MTWGRRDGARAGEPPALRHERQGAVLDAHDTNGGPTTQPVGAAVNHELVERLRESNERLRNMVDRVESMYTHGECANLVAEAAKAWYEVGIQHGASAVADEYAPAVERIDVETPISPEEIEAIIRQALDGEASDDAAEPAAAT